MYHACKEALSIIGDVNISTVTTPTPPPVDMDWLKRESGQENGSSSNGPTPPPYRPAPISNPGRSAPPPPGHGGAPSLPNRPGVAPRPIPAVASGNLPPPLIPQRPTTGGQP